MRRRGWLILGATFLLSLTSTLAAPGFPTLNAESRLPGTGPVAISGDTAIVGNLVYVRTPAGWLFQQVLNGVGPVALDGDTAVVGTNIYARTSAHWDLQATLPFWGIGSVALNQDTIAVNYGPLYVFQRTNSTWTLQAQLTPEGETNVLWFGTSVALDGGTIVVGAPSYNSSYYYEPLPGPGSAYVFSLNNGTWAQAAKLTDNDTNDISFGAAVAISGNTISIGGDGSAGPVTLFNYRSGLWRLRQTLSLGQSSLASPAYAMNPLAIQSNTLAVVDSSGITHIFNRLPSPWVESQTLNNGITNHILGPGVGLTTNAVIVASGASSQSAFIFESQPWTWQEQDVGDTGASGSYSSDTNALLISGSGANIGGTADAFHYLYRPYSNDLEMIVHVASIGGEDSYSRGGIMFRSSLDPGAPYVFVSQRQGQQIFFEHRDSTNGEGVIQSGPWAGPPSWLKLRKLGTNLVVSTSDDGYAWSDIVSTSVNLPENFYVGLGVTSERTGILATDVFDHLEINPIALPNAASSLTATSTAPYSITLNWVDNSDNESGFVVKRSSYGYYYNIAVLPANTTTFTDSNYLSPETVYSYIVQAIEPHGFGPDSQPASAVPLKLPLPWADQDIGPTEIGGDAYKDKSLAIVVTSGSTNSTVDAMHYVYQRLTGDFDIAVQVQDNNWYGSANGKVGLMVRSSLDDTSPYAFAYLDGTENVFVTRDSTGSMTKSTAPGGWIGELRIVRKGNVFSVFHNDASVTDVGLSKMAEQTLDLPSTVYLGFAVAGSGYGQPVSGNFWLSSLTNGPDVAPIVAPVLTATPVPPSQVKLSWTDGGLENFYYQAGYVQTDYGNVDYYLFDPLWGFYSNATSFVDTSIVPGMTRNYRIKLSLPNGDWIWSNFAKATAAFPTNNLPLSWQLKQVGIGQLSTAIVTESNRSFTIWGGGNELGGVADSLSGTFQPLTGDGSITVHLAGTVDTTGWESPAGKFGIMIRQSLDSRAPAAAAFANRSPSAWMGFMSRTSQGGVGSVTNQGLYMNTWLKLVRTGDLVTGYTSLDGIAWTELDSASIQMTDPVLIGIFAESENGPLASATFDNLQIAPPQVPAMSLQGFKASTPAQLQLAGAPGWTNCIEVSSDLVHWDSLTNCFNVSGSMNIADPAACTNSSRFYRARIQY